MYFYLSAKEFTYTDHIINISMHAKLLYVNGEKKTRTLTTPTI